MDKKQPPVLPKIRKDKKKNTQLPNILIGQNTNIFSQLSATYLQSKSSTTEQQNNFVSITPIIEYHDPNINRLIALLRKKADITKVKAAIQLKQEIYKMGDDKLEEFVPMFAQLFMEVVINQQSKQVTDEFFTLINHLLSNHKKIITKQIATLFGPFFVINKCNNIAQLKIYSTLFTGTDEQLHQKALILLLTKNITKKFLVFCRVIIQCEQTHKIGQQNYQRNCSSLLKLLKDFIKSYEILLTKKQQIQNLFTKFMKQINEIVSSKFVQQYFNVGGKAKSTFLEFYQMLVHVSIRYPNWEIKWEQYGKIVSQHFLDKDAVVQHAMWKYCNRQFIESTLQLEKLEKEDREEQKGQNKEKQKYWLFFKTLSKPDEKLLNVLKIGGQTLYKQLPAYCTVFPYTLFQPKQLHKSAINKISFIRKLMQTILQLQDQNQSRIQCYYQLSLYLIKILRDAHLSVSQLDERKQEEIKVLACKAEKQMVNSLQERFYKNVQISRNSFAYYIPTYFCKIVEEIQPNFDFVFDVRQVFPLYCNLTNGVNSQYVQKIYNVIYENCKDNQKLILQYLQNFPTKSVIVDMTASTTQIEITSKIFLLSEQAANSLNWFKDNWDMKIRLTVFDPRISQTDLSKIQEQSNPNFQTLNFKPSNRQLINERYFASIHDELRLKYFISCLQDEQHINIIPYMLSMVEQIIMSRNSQMRMLCMNKLLQIHQKSIDKLEKNQWMIGQAEVLRLRVIYRLVLEGIKREEQQQQENEEVANQERKLNEHLLERFLESYCMFVLAIHNYKLENEVQQLLKLVSKALEIEKVSSRIFTSARKSIRKAYDIFSKVGTQNKDMKQGEDRQRKNRLNRLLGFIQKVLWYAVNRKKQVYLLLLFEDIFTHIDWKYAQYRPDLWLIGRYLLQVMGKKDKKLILQKLLSQHDKYKYFLTLLMCCQLVLALQRHLDARKVFVEMQMDILREIKDNMQEQRNLDIMRTVINESVGEESYLLIFGARNLLKNMMKDYKNISQQIINRYLEICMEEPMKELKNQQKVSIFQKKCFLLINLCGELPLIEFSKIDQIYEELLVIVENENNSLKVLGLFAIVSTIWEANVGIGKITNEKNKQLVQKIVSALKQIVKQNNVQQLNFGRFCGLTFFNSMIKNRGEIQLNEYWNFLLIQVVWVPVEQGSLFHSILQVQRYKFINRIFSGCSLQMKSKIVSTIPKEIIKQIKFYRQILDEIQDEEQQNESQVKQPHFQNIINMFIEFAELLLRITSGLSQNIRPDEQIILEMLQCPFPGLKKTSFMLLKQIYQLNLVDKNPPNVFINYLKFDSKLIKLEMDPLLANTFASYLYSWQAIIQRRSTIQRPSTQQQQICLTLEDYLQNGQLHEIFLRNVFEILETSLQYTKNEEEYYITPDQLISIDLIVAVEDDLNMLNKMFRLTIRTLFMFIQNFPIYLRNFMDKNKKYKNICDRLLRNVISDSIFKQQIKKIQVRQHEWKTSGNFQIYVTIKNKQIYAQYIHDDAIRIGLRLMMKSNYPLTPISIEFGEGLKIDEGGRWVLMLQNQLCSRNNTIINGILLWKENIDKKLAGVEQCTICLDIVNIQGQLPKKACKTCKKKFHNVCILRWFSKSNKSQCPHCKSQFL